jgi:hypothetical protein
MLLGQARNGTLNEEEDSACSDIRQGCRARAFRWSSALRRTRGFIEVVGFMVMTVVLLHLGDYQPT